MTDRETAQYGLASLTKAGADKAQCVLGKTKKVELNVDAGEISLMRTTFNTSMSYKAIRDGRKGVTSSNKIDRSSIDQEAASCLEIAGASPPDPAYDIADKQESEKFSSGSTNPDVDGMFSRLEAFLEEARSRYPKTISEKVILDFSSKDSVFLNSNGVDFEVSKGCYNFMVMFTTREGKKASSFNYSGFSRKDLDGELFDLGSVRTLIEQSAGQLDLRSIDGKFTGDLIITPDCLGDFIGTVTGHFLSDVSLISGTSIYKDKLNKQVAAPPLTLHSKPVSDDIVTNYFVTGDGFKARNSTIIDRGILKTYLLSQYGANKTGRERAVNGGGTYVVDPGDRSFDDMVRSVSRGLLLCRFSGGNPNDNGDFSGVAKNSYYIEDGEIRYPVNETMVAGNVAEVFKQIKTVSRERIDFGSAVFPWVQTGGLTISGAS